MTTGRGRQRRQTAVVIEATQARAPISLLTRHDEAGVTHPERREDAPLQHLTQ